MITTKKYVITIVLLLVLAGGTFFGGMKLGQKGYSYEGGQYKIVNKNNYPHTVDYNLLWEALETLGDKYIDRPLDQQKILYGAIAGATAALGDPYTVFFNPKQLADFRTELKGSFDGIGAEIDVREGTIVVVAPLDDTPAQRAGILSGDFILKIDDTETTGMTVEQAVSRIRGERGTTVTLGLYRPSTKKQFEVKITRAKIEITSVKWEYKQINGKNIQVVNLSRFGDETVALFKKAAKEALDRRVDGIVLDLRDDPGGYLDAAVEISSLWVNQGDVVVTEQRSDQSKHDYKAAGTNILKDIPTVVLINGGSASASEIVAGALHDHDFAQLVGTKSFGKGSVQELIDLPQETALKVTIAKWLTPDGVNINKNGLEPNVKVERTVEQIEKKEDPQMDKALEIISK